VDPEKAYKVFHTKLTRNSLLKGRHFSEWAFLKKNVFTFLRGAEFLLEVSPGRMPIASLNPPLIKQREAYWCFSRSWFFLAPSADALVKGFAKLSSSLRVISAVAESR